MLTEQVRDRFLGAALGLAVGDALGSPLEGRSATAIHAEMGNEPTKMEGGGRRKLSPGEWTDDTSQYVATADSFISSRGFSGFDVAMSLLAWQDRAPRQVGPHTGEVLSRLRTQPDAWKTTGRDIWYRNCGVLAGNGALARCTVAALFFWDDLDRMIETTIQLCQITHFDPRVVESALAINFMLVQCLHRRFSDRLVDQTITFLEATRRSPQFRKLAMDYDPNTLGEYSNFSPYPPYSSSDETVLEALRQVSSASITGLHTSGFVVHTMQLSVWMLMNNDRFADALHRAVRLGGDADTQGAITGALMGARLGLAQVPNYWLAPLQHRAKLTSMAELLLERSGEVEEEDAIEGRREPNSPPPSIL